MNEYQKFKCRVCEEELADTDAAELHMILTSELENFKYPVFPIETCRFCNGCK